MENKLTYSKARILADYTQPQIAKKLKVSVPTISNWERYRTYPNILQYNMMCELYGVDSIIWKK